jgi:pimeloyl-ACP methyl ester carboxylesterase
MDGPASRDGVSVPRLVLFSGLGIDGGVFARQRGLPVRLETPTYPDPVEGDTLRSYAVRLAGRITPAAEGEALYLGGLSFGAAVALEAARVLRPRGVFVISAGFSGRAISSYFVPLLRGVGLQTPGQLRQALRLTPLFIRVVGRPDRDERRLMLSLLPRVNPRLCTWGGPAILDWEFPGGRRSLEDAGVRVHHIHGELDYIVPLHRVRPDHVVQGAGHAVNVTHPEEVNAYLMAQVRVQGSGFRRRPKGSGFRVQEKKAPSAESGLLS